VGTKTLLPQSFSVLNRVFQLARGHKTQMAVATVEFSPVLSACPHDVSKN